MKEKKKGKNYSFGKGGSDGGGDSVTCHSARGSFIRPSSVTTSPVLSLPSYHILFPRSSQFPDGEMIMKLYPLLVASPLSIDLDGGPISYESYAFSPRKASASPFLVLSPIRNPREAFQLLFHLLTQSRISRSVNGRDTDPRKIRPGSLLVEKNNSRKKKYCLTRPFRVFVFYDRTRFLYCVFPTSGRPW